MINEATSGTLKEDSPEAKFCHNCYSTLRTKKKLPDLSTANGLSLDEIPEELNLTDLEEQFIAKCLIFLKVVKLPVSRMKANKDKIINIRMSDEDISKSITSFPRTEENAGLIAVKLKRKMGLKTCHAEEFIDPEKPIRAVMKLKELRNPFYESVQINENFLVRESGQDVSVDPDSTSDDGHYLDCDPYEDEIFGDEPEKPDEVEPEEEDDVLNTVKDFQTKQNDVTCMVHDNPDEVIVENYTKKVISKKMKINSKKSFEIAPGMHTV